MLFWKAGKLKVHFGFLELNNYGLKMKLTCNYIQKPADGAEEKEEVQEEEEEVIRPPSVSNPYLRGSRCCHSEGVAHNQTS